MPRAEFIIYSERAPQILSTGALGITTDRKGPLERGYPFVSFIQKGTDFRER